MPAALSLTPLCDLLFKKTDSEGRYVNNDDSAIDWHRINETFVPGGTLAPKLIICLITIKGILKQQFNDMRYFKRNMVDFIKPNGMSDDEKSIKYAHHNEGFISKLFSHYAA